MQTNEKAFEEGRIFPSQLRVNAEAVEYRLFRMCERGVLIDNEDPTVKMTPEKFQRIWPDVWEKFAADTPSDTPS